MKFLENLCIPASMIYINILAVVIVSSIKYCVTALDEEQGCFGFISLRILNTVVG